MFQAFIYPDQVLPQDFSFIDKRPWKNNPPEQLASNLTILELVDMIFDMNAELTHPLMFEFPLIKGTKEEKFQQMIEFLETNTTSDLDFSKLFHHPTDFIEDNDYSKLVPLKYVAYERLELFYRVFAYMLIRPNFLKIDLCEAIRKNLLAKRKPDKGDWRDERITINSDGNPITDSERRDLRYGYRKKYVYFPENKKYYAEDSPYRNRDFRDKLEMKRLYESIERDVEESYPSSSIDL